VGFFVFWWALYCFAVFVCGAASNPVSRSLSLSLSLSLSVRTGIVFFLFLCVFFSLGRSIGVCFVFFFFLAFLLRLRIASEHKERRETNPKINKNPTNNTNKAWLRCCRVVCECFKALVMV
jgi:hypothetical protein